MEHPLLFGFAGIYSHQYVTLKVHERDSGRDAREVQVYRYLNSLTTSHIGALLVRTSLDDFEISTPNGSYPCLVVPPLGISLSQFRGKMPGKRMSEELLKALSSHLLRALDFLHTEAQVIHTGIQEKNILLAIEGQTILAHFEGHKKADPSSRKIDSALVIYQSRPLRSPNEYGRPILCDFGVARFDSPTFHGDIQPYIYRAPEVLLRIAWDCKVDIWNVGVMVWDLFENKHLFKAENSNGKKSNIHHLAEMIALLGPPPKRFLKRSDYACEYFDNDGKLKGGIEVPLISLEGSENFRRGPNKKDFLQFMRKMLQWLPEARPSAKELLSDPWMTTS